MLPGRREAAWGINQEMKSSQVLALVLLTSATKQTDLADVAGCFSILGQRLFIAISN